MNFQAIYKDVLPAAPASPLRVLFCGYSMKTTSGAWQMRALQVASRRTNWTVLNRPDDAALQAADLICFTKKWDEATVRRAHASRKPVVLDVIDGWAQPDDNRKAANAATARDYFKARWAGLPPFDGHIFADRRMYEDLGALSRRPTYLYHHHNPLLRATPLRPLVKTVGYEGSERFLGRWHGVIEGLCAARGLVFIVNPRDYGTIDIGFAARGDDFGGYLPSSYKSNVKMANFMVTGTPCLVGAEEISYHEVAQGGVRFFHDEASLAQRLDSLLPLPARLQARDKLLRAAGDYQLDVIVDKLEHYFMAICRERDVRNAA